VRLPHPTRLAIHPVHKIAIFQVVVQAAGVLQEIAHHDRVAVRHQIGHPGSRRRVQVDRAFFGELEHHHRREHFADTGDTHARIGRHRRAGLPVADAADAGPRALARDVHRQARAGNLPAGDELVEHAVVGSAVGASVAVGSAVGGSVGSSVAMGAVVAGGRVAVATEAAGLCCWTPVGTEQAPVKIKAMLRIGSVGRRHAPGSRHAAPERGGST
jgi:hypothetical protein